MFLKNFLFFIIISHRYLLLVISAQDGQLATEEQLLKKGESQLRDQILAILEHYKQEDPVGIPGAKIPDPKAIPDMKHSFSVAVMNFKNMNVYGLSKFKIAYVKSEVASMEVTNIL